MNRAKKIMKNQGAAEEKEIRRKKGLDAATRNKVLLGIGICLVLVLCLGVAYIQLRPRPILKVTGTDADGKSVTDTLYYKDALYDICNTEAQYNGMQSLYQQFYGSSFWEAENMDSKGRTGAQVAKKAVMDGLKQREILCMEAEKNGVSLSDEEKSKADEDLKTFMDGLTDDQKKIRGLDEDTVRGEIERQALADKYKNQVIESLGIDEEALKAGVSKEKYRQYDLQYYMISKKSTDDDGNEKELDAATLKKNKKAIEDVRKKAVKAKDFTKDIIADSDEDNTDDDTGVQYLTENLLETDTDFLDEKALKKVKKMKNDEISDVIETDDGYYVIKMVDNNDSSAYDQQCEQVVEDEKEKQFEAKYKSDIKPNYTTEVQSYWKGRVKLGGITAAE